MICIEYKFVTLAIESVLQPGTRLFEIRHGKLRISNNEFKFLCVSGSLGMKVTNMPRTANVLEAKLTGLVCVQTKNFPVQKNCRLICLLILCRISCLTVELFQFTQ